MFFLKLAFLDSGQVTWWSIKIMSPNSKGIIVINDYSRAKMTSPLPDDDTRVIAGV